MTSTLFQSDIRPDARRASRGWQDLIVDNFAGGGGASLGIERAAGRAVDVSINHDPDAVEMHRLNHPASWHVCESVWRFDPVGDLVKHFGRGRFKFDAKGNITGGVGLAWFSPDCRHFSRAKGGKPVSKRVRGLAWVVVKWAKLVRPHVILLENVREFQDWGPIVQVKDAAGKPLFDKNGQPVMLPCPKGKGQTFRRWTAELRRLGYAVEHRVMDAADYGAPTHRRRLFLVARRDGKPIVWPEPTHGPNRRKPYRTAAECIDWSIPCPSIFDRKRPLADKTLRRIAMGLKRYVLDNPKPYVVKVNHGRDEARSQPTDQPLTTVTAGHGDALVTPTLVSIANGNFDDAPSRTRGVDGPINTVTGTQKHALVTPTIVRVAHGDGPVDGRQRWGQTAHDASGPLPTVTGSKDFAVTTATLVRHFGRSAGADVEEPAPTVTAGGQGKTAVVAAHLTKFRFDSDGAAIDQPMPTITAGGDAGGRPAGAAHAMAVTAATLVQCGYGEAVGQAPRTLNIEEPLGTVVGGGQKHALVSAFLSEVGNTGGNGDYVRPADAPNATQTSKAKDLLVTAFLSQYFGESPASRSKSPEVPLPTITASDHSAVVTAWLAKHYGGVVGHGVEQPIGTVTSVDHHAVAAASLIRMNHGQKQWQGVDEPASTVTSQGNKLGLVYAFLTKFFGTAVGQLVDSPTHTVTGRDRFGVVTVEIDGTTYAIADIGMRMLSPRELARAQGFPDSYVLTGSKANQVHKIGNSVCPVMAEAMVRANCPDLRDKAVAA